MQSEDRSRNTHNPRQYDALSAPAFGTQPFSELTSNTSTQYAEVKHNADFMGNDPVRQHSFNTGSDALPPPSNQEEETFREQNSQIVDEKASSSFPYQKKMSQNFSFQWSPKKSKKSEDQVGGKRFIVVEPKPVLANNLDDYKKAPLESPIRSKRSISGLIPGEIRFNASTIIKTPSSNVQSPSASMDGNQSTKREFPTGRLHLLGKHFANDSPLSNPDTNNPNSSRLRKLSLNIGNLLLNKSHPVVRDDFVTIKLLGKGKYGDVFLTIHKSLGVVCALKSISKNTIVKEEGGVNQFVREVSIQMYLNDPYIAALWGIFNDEQNVYLIMEPALDGQLYKYMKQRRQLNEDETASLIKQLCYGVEYLQSEGVIHRDLKPENIIMHEGKLKICDFGWAVYNQDSFRETFCGTPLYLSPDVLKGDQYNDKVDNWAIGIITYEMLVGRLPFKITKESELEKIITDQVQFPEYVEISDAAKSFVLSLLDRNAESRIDMEAILSHPFLKQAG